MRRPVKPFVTEYRGGSRRPSGQGSGPGVDLFKAEPAPSSSSPPTPSPWGAPSAPSHGEPQEDGYEAALRAADALFSGVRPATAAPQSTPAIAAGETPKPATGRVLRVLDEPPTAEMLELQRLEAEHAPKKRGRKPGSKNKPKVAALVDEPAEAAAQPVMPAVEAASSTVPAATITAAVAARAIANAPARRPDEPRGERYAWVRTQLKPGQQWKRRLPKVAW